MTRTSGETRESVTWDDLRRVTILTTDRGPFVEDVWWLLEHRPGCSPEAVVEAMGSTERACFIIWELPG